MPVEFFLLVDPHRVKDASTLIPEVYAGERMKVESWRWNKQDCHCKTFQKASVLWPFKPLPRWEKQKVWLRSNRQGLSEDFQEAPLNIPDRKKSWAVYENTFNTENNLIWFSLFFPQWRVFFLKKISCILSCQKWRPRTILPSMFFAVRSLSSNRKALTDILSSVSSSEPINSSRVSAQIWKRLLALVSTHHLPPKTPTVPAHSKVNGGLESSQLPVS